MTQANHDRFPNLLQRPSIPLAIRRCSKNSRKGAWHRLCFALSAAQSNLIVRSTIPHTLTSVAIMQLHVKTILNLKEKHSHFVCHDVRLTRGQEPRIEVKVEPRRGCKGICSGCGDACPGYDRLPQREFIHVPLWGIAVIFLYCMRRLACPTCGVTVEVAPWSTGKSPLTISYAWYLSEWAKLLSMQEVAIQFRPAIESFLGRPERRIDGRLIHQLAKPCRKAIGAPYRQPAQVQE